MCSWNTAGIRPYMLVTMNRTARRTQTHRVTAIRADAVTGTASDFFFTLTVLPNHKCKEKLCSFTQEILKDFYN